MEIKVVKKDSVSEYKVGHCYKYVDSYFTIVNSTSSDPCQEHYAILLLPEMRQGKMFNSLKELYEEYHVVGEQEVDVTLEVSE